MESGSVAYGKLIHFHARMSFQILKHDNVPAYKEITTLIKFTDNEALPDLGPMQLFHENVKQKKLKYCLDEVEVAWLHRGGDWKHHIPDLSI